MRQKLAPAHQGEDLFNCILSRKSFCFHYTKSYDLTIFRVEGDAFFDADLNCDDKEQEELPIELPSVTGFVATEAVIVIAVEGGLMFVEMVKGTIIPKVPTKKADLVLLCKQLKLAAGGTAKELRARLIKKLKPSPKTEHREIKLNPNLVENFKKTSKITLLAVRKGIPESLLDVDNEKKKVFHVNISYTGGEALATLNKTLDFPQNLESVELTLATPDVIIFSSSTQITLFDIMLQLLRIFRVEHSVISMCVNAGGKFLFVQDDDQVWRESLDNMMKGKWNAVHIAGSGKGTSKDG